MSAEDKSVILVSAASGSMLKPLTRRLGRSTYIKRADLEARKSRLSRFTVYSFKCGMGRNRAVAAVERAIEVFSPESVIFIGLAGALRGEYRVGDPFMISSATYWPGEVENLSIEHAVGLKMPYENNEMPLVQSIKGGLPVRRCRLLTVDSFVNSISEKRRLGIAGFDLVDMEFGAVAAALSDTGISLTGLVTVSDTLYHGFPKFKIDQETGMNGMTPTRLVYNSLKASKILGTLTFRWLKALDSARRI